jgi:tetratricopeptide (TPR) repeat protein
VCLAFAAGCSNPLGINGYNYDRFLDYGHEAEQAGNLKAARYDYGHAWGISQVGRLGAKDEARALYELGRVEGQLCDFDESKKHLLQALELEEQVEGPGGGWSLLRLFELARLHFAREQYAQAASYYDRAIPLARKIAAERDDPIGFANELETYATALERSGDAGRAAELREEVAELHRIHPGARAYFTPVPYPKECPGS